MQVDGGLDGDGEAEVPGRCQECVEVGGVVEPATLEATDAFVAAHPDLPRGARRLVLEGRDGVARALRCQARDAAG